MSGSSGPDRPLALTLPLEGNRVIEASAGTGKTWTLSALYLRLALGLRRGLDDPEPEPLAPERILVLTFTNAAADELRDRIRGRLALAAAALRDGEARSADARNDPVIEALHETLAPDARAVAARRLARAAEAMDDAAIGTIHGWALQTLQANPFRSRVPFDLELVDARERLEGAARDYFRVHLERLPPAVWSVAEDALGPPDALARVLGRLLDQPARIEAAPSAPSDDPFGGARDLAERIGALKAAWRAGRDEAEAVLLEALAAGRLSRVEPDRLRKVIAAYDAWAAGDQAAPGKDMIRERTVEKVKERVLWLSQEALVDKTLAKHESQAPRHPLFERFEAEAPRLLGPTLLPREEMARLRAHAWAWMGERLRGDRDRDGRWTFGDLLAGLRDALTDPEHGAALAARLGAQFPVALVDEFQDTDALQYEVFSRIYLNDEGRCPPERALLLIGDPKQAIYRFRGADLETYLRARTQAEDRRHRLGTNFRSTQAAVDAVNAVFGAGDHPEGPFRDRRLPFEPVRGEGRGERLVLDRAPVPALAFLRLPERFRAQANQEVAQGLQAEACAEQIATLLAAARDGRCTLGDDALRARDVAVLVSNGRQAAKVRAALAARNVASVYLSLRESVYESAEAADVLLALRAVADPSEERAVRSALATRSLGLPLDELDRLARDELRWEGVVEAFRGLGRLWDRHGVLPVLRRLLLRHGAFHRLRAAPDGERIVTNVLHLGELLQAASRTVHGRDGLVRYLADAIEEAAAATGPAADERLQRLESDESLVRVLTVHKSKGLEFEVVHLPFGLVTGRDAAPREGDVAVVHQDGDRVADLAASEETLLAEREEEHREGLRLLYVALTRARHACVVGVPEWKLGDRRRDALATVLARRDEVRSSGETAENLAAAHPDVAVDTIPEHLPRTVVPAEEAGAPARPPRRLDRPDLERNRNVASYSGLARGAGDEDGPFQRQRELEEELAEDASGPEPAHGPEPRPGSLYAFPRGAEAGNFLHGLLEWAGREGFDRVLADPKRFRDEVKRRCLRHGLAPWSEALARQLLALLPVPITDDGAALGRLTTRRCRAELDFLFPAQSVDTRTIDDLLATHELPGRPRPALAPRAVHGMLRGFVDLVFEHEGRHWIVDYKSNHLGDGPGAYGELALRQEILRHRYDLQYGLYTLALHRLLAARLQDYDYDRHVGGVRYLFLRALPDGAGIWRAKPARALVEALDGAFRGEPRAH